MKISIKHVWFSASIVMLFAAFAIALGCSGQSEAETEIAELHEDEHAGHNHGPGEHVDFDTQDAGADLSDWCAEHSVPESQCTQ